MWSWELGVLMTHSQGRQKQDSKSCQAPMRHVAYRLQKPFSEKIGQLEQQDIITQTGVDETVE